MRRISTAGALESTWASGHLFYQNEASVTNGTTIAINPPIGSQTVDIEISLTGQTLVLLPASGRAMNFFINRMKHDGTAAHGAPGQFGDWRTVFGDQSTHKGNWNATIHMVRNATATQWLGHISAFATLTAGDNIWGHGGDYWRFDGRFYASNAAASQEGIRVGSIGGESGQVFVRAVATW